MKFFLSLLLLNTLLLANIGTVASMRGEVKIVRSTENISAKMGSNIKLKDVVNTKENSKVQVIMMDDTVITIGANSRYAFDEYGDDHAQMRLEKGFFRAITGKIGKIAPEKFTIKTRSATIGIRGTHFSAKIMEDKEIIKCIRGKISVTTAKKIYIIPAGSMITLVNGVGKPLPINPKQQTLKNDLRVNTLAEGESVEKHNVVVQDRQGIKEDVKNTVKTEISVPKNIQAFDPDN